MASRRVPGSCCHLTEVPRDGHRIIVATQDGAVYTWDTSVDQWIDYACQVAGRNLSEDEWHTTFRDRTYRRTCP
jgi:hypothetical protein